MPLTAPNANDVPPPTVRPEDKCTVEGTVVNGVTGEALRKTNVILRPMGQRQGVPVGTTTDNTGHFLIDGVDPGRYFLTANRNGFGMQSYSPQGNSRQNASITLANGQKLTQVVFKLTPYGVVTGHIMDQDGEPLAHVQIQLMRFQYQRGKRQLMPAGSANTNDLGEYRAFDVRPGKYVMSAVYQAQNMYMGPGNERIVGSPEAVQLAEERIPTMYYPNTMSPEGAAQIEVAPGAQMRGIDMTLVRTRTVRVRGHVNLSSSGRQRRNVMLMLIPRDGNAFQFGPGNNARPADDKGNFEIRGVVPGSYNLIGDQMIDGQRYSARVPVDVGNSTVEGIEVNFQPPADIKGRVVLEENGDLKGATLNVNMQPTTMAMRMGGTGGQVKDDLTFMIQNVGPQSYDVNVSGYPEGFYLKSVRMGDQDITETGADFTQAVPAGEMTVVLNPNGGQIEGTVQNSESQNAAGVTVTLIPDEKHRSLMWMYKTASTDQNGHFTMTGVRPGDYKIYAWEDIEPGAYQDPDFVKPHESAGKSVSVKASSHESVQLTIVKAQ